MEKWGNKLSSGVLEPHQCCNAVSQGVRFPLVCTEQVQGSVALIVNCIHKGTVSHKSLIAGM